MDAVEGLFVGAATALVADHLVLRFGATADREHLRLRIGTQSLRLSTRAGMAPHEYVNSYRLWSAALLSMSMRDESNQRACELRCCSSISKRHDWQAPSGGRGTVMMRDWGEVQSMVHHQSAWRLRHDDVAGPRGTVAHAHVGVLELGLVRANLAGRLVPAAIIRLSKGAGT